MLKHVVLLLVAMSFSGCSGADGNKVEKVAGKSQENNIFDAREWRPGDSIAGLEIESLQAQPGNNPDYSARIKFKGFLSLSGKYKNYQNDKILGDNVCFYADEKSEFKVPKLIHDERYTWFCFTNKEAAKKELGPPGSEGEIKIKIADYQIKYAPSQIWNLATFSGILLE